LRDHKKRHIRLNKRAVGAALILILIAIPTFFIVGSLQDRRVRSAALARAREFERAGHPDQAIRHLRHYLGSHPNDLTALALQARLLAETAQSEGQILEAADLNDQLLRRTPDAPDSQDVRRRLAELYIRYGVIHQRSPVFRIAPGRATSESRYRVAEMVALQLFGPGKTNVPADHRLLAMAREGLAVPGDTEALNGAIDEYQKALKGDPGDVIAAERLARLYLVRLHDPNKARQILDELVQARPQAADVRLVRYQFFMQQHDLKQATAELEDATRLAPQDLAIRLTASNHTLTQGDTAGAQNHLDALPKVLQENNRVQVMRGLIALREQRPEEAISGWQKSLLMAGGSDVELTWWLAYTLLQMGDTTKARPLVARFRQISGEYSQSRAALLQAELDLRTGRPARAVYALERVKGPIDEGLRLRYDLTLGRAYEALWDDTKALASYRHASQIDPAAPEARLAAVKLLLNRKPEDALAEIERGLSAVHDEPGLWLALAEVLLKLQARLPAERRSWARFDDALKEAARLAPKSAAPAMLQAQRMALQNDFPSTVQTLKQAVDLVPKSDAIAIAYASNLARMGQIDEALRVLERASAPGAAGDKATLRIGRAGLLLSLGRGREARAVLVRDLEQVPLGERPAIWRALGQLDASQGDLDGARNAYLECARLLPEDPRPRLALLDLAMNSGDEAMVRSIVEELRGKDESEGPLEKSGREDLTYRLCRVQELLWLTRTSAALSAARRDPRLEEADKLMEGVVLDAPEMPIVHLLHGELMERLDKTDEAVAAYRNAWSRGAEAALPRLVNLLTRLHRTDELAKLKQTMPAGRLDRLSTLASLQHGDSELAVRFLAQTAPGESETPGSQLWRAQMLERIGKSDEAETILRAMAEQRPADLESRLRLLRVQAAHGEAKAVAASIERIRADFKLDPPELVEARCRLAANDRLAADKAFEAALKRWPKDANVSRYAASYYEETGRRDEAQACLRRALQNNPGDRAITRQLALLLATSATDLASWERAWETLGPEPNEPKAAEERVARAVVLSYAPDPVRKEQAIERLEALVADLPIDSALAPTVRANLASLLIKAGRPSRACQLAALSATSGTDPGAIALYAEALIQAKRWDEAEIQLDRLTALGPDSPQAVRLRAELIREKAGSDHAVPALEKAVADRDVKAAGSEAFGREVFVLLDRMGPAAADAAERVGRLLSDRHPAASWMLARVKARRGMRTEAVALCRRALDNGGPADRAQAVRTAAEIAIAPGADAKIASDVETLFKDALARDPDAVDLLVYRAMFEHMQSHYEEEVRLYRDVLRRLPGHAIALNNLAWILSEGLHQPSEALTYIDDLVQHIGRNALTLDTRGMILHRLGRHDEAIRDLEEANHSKPSAVTEFHLALAYHEAGREDEFRKYRDRVKEAGLKPEQLDAPERAAFEALWKL
jgi:cellulose synthase operon protein C